jgi:hypothetical protein
MRGVFLIVMSIMFWGEEVWAQSGAGAPTWRPVVMGKNGLVAAEHPLQALAGLRVLQNGGNAVDAAVAVFYMTAVNEPSEAGLGGGGFLLAYIKQLDRVIVINGSGGAPALLPGSSTRRRWARWAVFHLGPRRCGWVRPAVAESTARRRIPNCSQTRSRRPLTVTR